MCKDFVNKIYNKTECFTSKNVKLLNYVCLITNGLECIAIKLNKNGNIIEKSSLLVDEEFDILDSLNDMNIFDIKYKILNVKNNFSFMTRREKDIENFINFKLSNLSKKDFNSYKYCYDDINEIYETNDFYKIVDLYRIAAFSYIYEKEEILANLISFLESEKELKLSKVDNKHSNKYNNLVNR